HKITEHAFCFVLPDNKKCKILWKSAVEHHAFFRLTDRVPVEPKKSQLFRLRSRFHPSFSTEYQLHNLNMFGSSSFRKRKKSTSTVGSCTSLGGNTSKPSTPITSKSIVQRPADIRSCSSTSSSFRRVPSKRFTSRPSFNKREIIEDQYEQQQKSKEQTRKEFFIGINDDFSHLNRSSMPSVYNEHENAALLSSGLPPPIKPLLLVQPNIIPNSSPRVSLNAPNKPPRKLEIRNNISYHHNDTTIDNNSQFEISTESK
ncbi:unnamed protein product, partial [Schistosoma turkestanicum]